MLAVDILAVTTALLLVTAWAFSRGRSVSHIKGPKNAEWVVGHEHYVNNQKDAASVEFRWFKEFGNIFRMKGCFNRDILWVADPKAIHHIFQATYNFPKPNDVNTNNNHLFGGKGLISSIGPTHARQRKVLLPAFSAGQLRQFLGIFHDVGAKLSAKWNDIVGVEGSIINVHEWLSRATLEVIGESAFTYKFDSVEGEYQNTELGAALNGLFIDSGLHPPRSSLLYNALIRVSPTPIVQLLNFVPSNQHKRFGKYFELSVRVVRRMMESRKSASVAEDDKDVLGVLLRANESEDPNKRLSDIELTAQITLLIIAGHDTTAGTLTWMLWELAKDPKSQARVRAEIRETRKRIRSGVDFTGSDYDSMPFLNASIKEALRLHPIVSTLFRQAAGDDVLPLSESLMTKNGLVTEIPISRNQDLHISLASYNRLQSVWGEDADKWNPERWLNMNWSKKNSVSVGMTSNLMSFSGGVQGCIGWKFAYMEAQAMATQLLEAFEFTLPVNKPQIIRLPISIMVPIVEGELEKGAQMPLVVKPVAY